MRKILQTLFLAPAASLALLAGGNALAGGLVEFEFDADHFPDPPEVNNPYWPLTPGKFFVYVAETDEGCELNLIDVTHDVHEVTVGGEVVKAVEVWDMAWLDEDNAEDWAKVLNFVPIDDEEDCLKTKEWSPLERGAVEHKYYCPNVDDEGSLLLIEEVSGGRKVFVELILVGPVAD